MPKTRTLLVVGGVLLAAWLVLRKHAASAPGGGTTAPGTTTAPPPASGLAKDVSLLKKAADLFAPLLFITPGSVKTDLNVVKKAGGYVQDAYCSVIGWGCSSSAPAPAYADPVTDFEVYTTDANGNPVDAGFTAGQAHDAAVAQSDASIATAKQVIAAAAQSGDAATEAAWTKYQACLENKASGNVAAKLTICIAPGSVSKSGARLA